MKVGWLLIATGTITGGLVGLVSAAALSPFGEPSTAVVLAIVASGIVLDGVRLVAARPSPPTSNRQVPQEWSRLFDPRIVAVLYGARLGVGPLTILSTWTWWSVTVAAAMLGPIVGLAVGASFGFVRLTVTVMASVVSARFVDLQPSNDPSDSTRPTVTWFALLRAKQRSNWIAINGVSAAAVLAIALVGCGSPDDGSAQSALPSDSSSVEPELMDRIDADFNATPKGVRSSSELPTMAGLFPGGEDTEINPITGRAIVKPRPSSIETLATVQLEDVVRTAPAAETPTAELAGSTELAPAEEAPPQLASVAEPTSNPSSAPLALARTLIYGIEGFAPVEEPEADRYLDLEAASNLQPDPTEEVALLETRGFKGGWTRVFRNDNNNDVAVASVYHFEDAAEAEFYLEDGLITIGGYGGKFFDVEDQPGVRGFVQYFSETDESGTEELVSLGAAFQTGPRWHLVYFVGSVDTVTPDLLLPAVAAQRQLASAS
ncbi:MAG: hypothetical protein ACRBK7_23050 [Acidimicrobiales bacterium]